MNKLRLRDITAKLFQGLDVSQRLEGQGQGQLGFGPTPEDPPLVVVDLVPEAGCVRQCQLEFHTILLDDCGERWGQRLDSDGAGGGKGEGGGSLTMGHRVQLQCLGHGPPQARGRGLPHLGLEQCVHHRGLAQPALPWE